MRYHLQHAGQNLGVFLLQELLQKRETGELTGQEMVWTEGMSEWRPLDEILQNGVTSSVPPPLPPDPKKQTRETVVVMLVAGVVVVMSLVGLVFYQSLHRLIQSAAPPHQRDVFVEMTAMEAASKPVVLNSKARPVADANTANRDFRIRQYVEGYELRGERNPASDALALEFLQAWISSTFGGAVDTNLPSVQEMGTKLANDPSCTDPLVLTMAGFTDTELHESVRRLERALTGYEHSKHLGYPKLFAVVTLEQKLIHDQESRFPVLDAQALGHLKEAFTDGSIRPEDQAELGEALMLGWGKDFLERQGEAVAAIVRAQGVPYEWLALTVEGQNEINKAWKARGGGYSDTVTAEGEKEFEGHLELARKNLTLAWKLRPDLPLAPCRMIYVSLGDAGIGEMRLWFDRTVASQINYQEAWDDMRWGLRPRWYGNIDTMLAFGVTALKTKQFDTDVPHGYLTSLSQVEEEMGLSPGQHLYSRDDIWPHLQEMYEGYLAEPSLSEKARNYWLNSYAVVAYLAGKYDVAARQLQALNWQMSPKALTQWGVDLSAMPLEVAARTGAESNAVAGAESLRKSGDLAGALKKYNALAGSTADSMTHNFIQDRIATLGIEERMRGGEWVDFLPTNPKFTGWHVSFGKCSLLPDGALEVGSDEAGHMLYSRVRLGKEFEVRGQFEVVSSTSNAFQGGLVMGNPEFETYNWYAFRMKRNSDEGDVVAFAQHWSARQLLAPLPLNNGTNSFTFRFHDGRVSATVNDREVFHEVEPPAEISVDPNAFLLGLGAFGDANSTVIRYRNIQVRKLPSS